jgi:hypothetical protein
MPGKGKKCLGSIEAARFGDFGSIPTSFLDFSDLLNFHIEFFRKFLVCTLCT